ncbi:MAG TPA: hypothetical protein VN282_20710 [Pyrinomonadaceae bacterium]|nr:hypothetical protein [Pyrinomonadaceae bacterium]
MMNRTTTSGGSEVHLRTLRILWVAFLVCVALFVLITWVTRPSELPDELSRGVHPLLYALAALAVSTVAASFLVKSAFYRRAAEHRQPALTQAGFTIAMALCESAVLFGLVGVFVTRNDAAYLLFALGAVGMLLHFPRREQVEAAFHKSLV